MKRPFNDDTKPAPCDQAITILRFDCDEVGWYQIAHRISRMWAIESDMVSMSWITCELYVTSSLLNQTLLEGLYIEF